VLHRIGLIGLILLSLSMIACATASGGNAGGDDAGTNHHPDSHINVSDSPPGQPDAPVGGQPDAPGASCSKSPCSLSPQCGCGPGMACDLDGTMIASGGTMCRTAGPGGTDAPCTATTDCAAGQVCLGNPGLCKKWCANNGDCSSNMCVVDVVSGTTPIPGAIVCSDMCNPTNATGCGVSQGCHVYAVDPMAVPVVNFTWCTPVGAGGQGATCTTDADCQADYGCFNTGTANECLHWCQKAPAAGSCPGVTMCSSLMPAAVVGGIEYGVCF
jgi:hypothetical protein